MPTPYNRDFTRRKSALLHDYDCRGTGNTRSQGASLGDVLTHYAEVTLDEAVEAGECIAMVRVGKGFKVLGATVAWNVTSSVIAVAGAITAFGDPYACGRLCNGPLDMRQSSNLSCGGSFTSCGILTKIGKFGDGCGIGYTYQCDTDLVITNLYGRGTAFQGGFGTGEPSGGGDWGGALPVGTVIAVEVRGIQT